MRLLRNIISVRSFCLRGIKAAECVKCLRALNSFPDTQILCSVLVVWEHVHDAGGELVAAMDRTACPPQLSHSASILVHAVKEPSLHCR